MKKTVFFLLCAFFLAHVSCKSMANAGGGSVTQEHLKQIEQNKALGLPLWAGCAFNSAEEGAFLGGYKSSSKSFYAAGSGEGEVAARLNARLQLASYCKEQLGVSDDFSSVELYGSRIVDTFISEDGIVYILMFITEKDARRSLVK